MRTGLLYGALLGTATATNYNCKFDDNTKTLLNFFEATVLNANLGGFDSTNSDKTLTYGNVGVNRQTGKKINLVVMNTTEYVPKNANAPNLNGEFGQINMQSPKASWGLSYLATSFTFSFVDAETGNPVVLAKFPFSFFDMDGTASGATECMTTKDFHSVMIGNMDTTQLVATTDAVDSSFTGHCSTQVGVAEDNPTLPEGLTDHQISKAVEYVYVSKSVIEVRFLVGCCANGGRNFGFAGNTNILPDCNMGGTAAQDVHLAYPGGGRADFRGFPNKFYNLISTVSSSLNFAITETDFRLNGREPGWVRRRRLSQEKKELGLPFWNTKTPTQQSALIHGTFITEVHIAAHDPSAGWLNLSFWANKVGANNYAYNMINGTCGNEYVALGPKGNHSCGGLTAQADYSTLTVETPEVTYGVTVKQVYARVAGAHHRLDVKAKPKAMSLPPHGLLGQGMTGPTRNGRVDTYPATGEYTTVAWAEGAIDGVPAQYEVPYPFATREFIFSPANRAAPAAGTKLVEALEASADV